MRKALIILIVLMAVSACSTTRRIPQGQSRLKETKVQVVGEGPDASLLESYVKQKPNDYLIGKWNPLIGIYNLSSGRGTRWDRFCEKLGVAPVIYDSTLVEPGCQGIERRLEYLGWYGSKVTAETTVKRRKAKVTYTVEPGRQYTLRNVNYLTPNRELTSDVLADSSRFTIRQGDVLSQQSIEAEAERMASTLRNRGYYGLTSNHFFCVADTTIGGGQADLVLRIAEHTRNETEKADRPLVRYRFGKVEVVQQAPLQVNERTIRSLNRIREGSLYRDAVVNYTYQRFSGINIFNTVNIQLQESETDSATVDCKILLSPAKLHSLKLNLEGSVNSTGLFGVTPSISYMHRNLFGGGEVFSLGFRGNFQFKVNDDTRSNELAVNSSLQLPRFLGLPDRVFNSTLPQTQIDATFNYQNRPEYTRTILSTTYGYAWSMRRRFNYQVMPLKLNFVRIFDMSESFYEKLKDPYLQNAYSNHFDMGTGASFYYTTDPTINPKSTYFYLRAGVDVAGNVLSLLNPILDKDDMGHSTIFGIPYSQYVRGEISAVQTVRFGQNNEEAIAIRLLAGAGYAYGNSTSLPFEQFFYAGGSNSMRGWMARSIGPGGAPLDTTFSIANQAGDMHLEANIEYRFPMIWKLQGAIFADAGNIYKLRRNDENDEAAIFDFNTFLKYSALNWGVGIRLDLGLLLARVDFGFKLYDPRIQHWYDPSYWFDKDCFAVHFGIGYPF